ncbi:hypothetical protein [Micromonospora rubida]|uniref:hypothetical protein n=1 Tax=Micromonospora rubida TaxID=2697657 RepID=UPI0013781237|nr:hypothetical protein [Micromonospora rubida]NBE82467.1 hypothetical protein [Micromonospora rubida]
MTAPVAAPVRPPRPTSVTVACWLQVATVLILLGLVALVVYEAVRFDGEISRAARLVPDADPAEVRDERDGNVFGSVFQGSSILLLAGWLAGTALPLLRGRNVARILVFVSGGGQLLLCLGSVCSGALLFPFILALGFSEGLGPEGEPLPEEDFWQESRFLETLYGRQESPGEVLFPIFGISMLTVLLLTATVVLLVSLPPANQYFRPRAQPAGPVPYAGWPTAPVPYAGWPTAPLPPAGAWVPAGYPVPPGYLICPDPALHLAYPPTSPGPAGPASVPPGSTPAPAGPPATDPPAAPGS